MKKLVSISVALALLVTFMVPVAVAADFPDDPGTYSKTPFGILGSVFTLVGAIVTDLAEVIDGFGLPVTAEVTVHPEMVEDVKADRAEQPRPIE